ncbi:hypothetical protein M7I_2337 [Glarea lozoyensis 74030]|uniref:Uncharacterized protein n=1 Tax=Glarea lozoyensis (strain ATCC 74030 / MF5533) TaxID=1104152 RepID=H0EIH9_GLAL7|nr:hypothetical protein M7I_2337 [Glarea lozoyensis 74030]
MDCEDATKSRRIDLAQVLLDDEIGSGVPTWYERYHSSMSDWKVISV